MDFDTVIDHPNNKIACNNYSREEAKKLLMNHCGFSVFHLNCRSLKAHFDEVSDLLDDFDFSFPVIGLSETWITDNIKQQYNFPGFNAEFHCRENDSPYGGVALYIKNGITYKLRNDLNSTRQSCEAVWIEILVESLGTKNLKNNIVLSVIYRPPSLKVSDYMNYIENVLYTISLENKYVIIMGDININTLTSTSSPYLNCLNSFNLKNWIH